MAACTTCGSTDPETVPGVCPACGLTRRIGASAWLDWVVPDRADRTPPPHRPDPLAWPGYEESRQRAAERAGTDEAVVVAHGRLRGTDVEVVVVAWEFAFLGGSMGSDVGDRIAAGFDLGRELALPVLLAPSTGGARMQEGMASLVQMASSTVASRRHAAAGLLQVAVLRDPTTGGVFASHANLADVILAEPGTTMGFAGPRVARAMTGGTLPEGSHTARGARAAGLLDEVVPRADLPAVLTRVLRWGQASAASGQPRSGPGHAESTARPRPASAQPGTRGPASPRAHEPGQAAAPRREPGPDAWTQVALARRPDRLRAPAHLAHLDIALELHGDRAGSDDPSIRPVMAWLDERAIMVIAMDPTVRPNPRPGGYRKAWRGLRLAGRLGIPIVTLVDTPGADASASSEAAGIASHIARTFAEVLEATSPVVAAVIGEGGSGGAMALATGDRLIIQEHAMFSVIAPEGAAAILHHDPTRAPEVARLLDPTASRLAALGLADEVVPEPGGAEVATLWAAVARHLAELDGIAPTARGDRWRHPLRGH
jgi:acetyl-CoA carboxylase beta subunit/acetyl-CoA carboxylase alpha subunit